MRQEKIKRNWEVQADIAELFDTWCEQTRTLKSVAVELGLWVIMHMDANARQACLQIIDQRPELGPDYVQYLLDLQGAIGDDAQLDAEAKQAAAELRRAADQARRAAERGPSRRGGKKAGPA